MCQLTVQGTSVAMALYQSFFLQIKFIKTEVDGKTCEGNVPIRHSAKITSEDNVAQTIGKGHAAHKVTRSTIMQRGQAKLA